MKLYKKIAHYYDKLIKQDYKKDVILYDKIIKRFTKGKKLLEIGCATGRHLIEFIKIGYNVSGIDESKEMVKQAKKQLQNIRLYKMKMEKLNLKEKFNVIALLNRTLLFIKNEKELENTIKNFYNHLLLNGILIFDLNFHKDYIDTSKTDTYYFNDGKTEGSLIEDYDKRENKILWSINLSIKDKKIIRLIDSQEFLLLDIKKLLKLLKTNHLKPFVFSIKGRKTKNYKQKLIIVGQKYF